VAHVTSFGAKIRTQKYGNSAEEATSPITESKEALLSILWIILIVVLVLALLGFFSRGAW